MCVDRGKHKAPRITDDNINYCSYASLLEYFLTCLCSDSTAVLAQRRSRCSHDGMQVLKNRPATDMWFSKARFIPVCNVSASKTVIQQMGFLITATVATPK